MKLVICCYYEEITCAEHHVLSNGRYYFGAGHSEVNINDFSRNAINRASLQWNHSDLAHMWQRCFPIGPTDVRF